MTVLLPQSPRMESDNRLSIQIADIVIELFSKHPVQKILQAVSYLDFGAIGEPDLSIQAFYGDLPPISLKEADRVFVSGGLWSLYRVDGKIVFVLESIAVGPDPYRMAVFDREFRHGEIYSRYPHPGIDTPGGMLPNPFEYPLAEAMMICLLAQDRGLLIHACGINDHGRGYLFAGNSTNGKSTMARLWKDRATILNDDRIVLRWRDGRFWMYGTPWHGTYSEVSPQGIPLEKIFFLSHAESNSVQHVGGAAAASMLLARCFPPFWDERGMQFTLDFCAKVTEKVSCYKLGFVPDEGVLDVVQCAQ